MGMTEIVLDIGLLAIQAFEELGCDQAMVLNSVIRVEMIKDCMSDFHNYLHNTLNRADD